MIKIMVINPNTSINFTQHIQDTLSLIKRSDTYLTVLCPNNGPETIESAYDEMHAALPTLDLVMKANIEKYDAVVLACFSDPGLEAAKEISNIPVLGIEESSLHIAAMLGARFTVITPRKERVAARYEHVYRRGLDHFLASVRSLDLSVYESEAEPVKTKKRVMEVARKAAEEDGAEVVILGCAGMSGYAAEIEEKIHVKVIDPTSVAFKLAEAMADLKLMHSKAGIFSTPPKKTYVGYDH